MKLTFDPRQKKAEYIMLHNPEVGQRVFDGQTREHGTILVVMPKRCGVLYDNGLTFIRVLNWLYLSEQAFNEDVQEEDERKDREEAQEDGQGGTIKILRDHIAELRKAYNPLCDMVELNPSPENAPELVIRMKKKLLIKPCDDHADHPALVAIQEYLKATTLATEAEILHYNPESGTVCVNPNEVEVFHLTPHIQNLMAFPRSGYEWVPIYFTSKWARFIFEGERKRNAATGEGDHAKAKAITARLEEVRARMPPYVPGSLPPSNIHEILDDPKMNALDRGKQLLSVPMVKLPVLAVAYMRDLASRVGMCVECCLAAYTTYAHLTEGLALPDDTLYHPPTSEIERYNEIVALSNSLTTNEAES